MASTAFEPVSLTDWVLRLFPREHISASAIKQYVRCPEQFRRVQILGEKARPGGAMILGISAHETASHNFTQKLVTEQDVPLSEVEDFYAADLDERVDEAGGAAELDWSGAEWADKTPADALAKTKDAGAKIVKRYHEEQSPDLFPRSIEAGFLVQPDGMPLPVKGYIDLVARRRDPITKDLSDPFIVERKTRKDRRPPKSEDIFQAGIYALVEDLPVEIQISSRSSGETVVHRPEVGSAEQSQRMLTAMILDMAATYALHGPDEPWPGTGRLHDWACSFCSARPTCVWWM